MPPTFMIKTLFHLAILLMTVDEGLSHTSRTRKDRNVPPSSKQRSSKGNLTLDLNDLTADATKPVYLDLFVVVDPSSYRYHGDDTEHYVMNMINVAASLWRGQSLSADVTLRVAKLLILKEAQDDLEITNHANLSLRTFCQWQKSHYVTDEVDGIRFDVAILITRVDIHIGGNYDAIGIAYNRRVCDPQFHCALCEDRSPMILSHTVAHEIGHLLGIRHDSDHNTCPDRVFIMSGYATSGYRTFIWSQCSRQALREFFSSTHSACLEGHDAVTSSSVLDASAMPGSIYGADYQCQMLYGPLAKACSNWKGSRICDVLKCRVENNGSPECVTDGRPALQGTSCGLLKWCSRGFCVKRLTPDPVHAVAPLEETTNPNRHSNKPISQPHCSECNTFPYMDTPVPTTKQTLPSKKGGVLGKLLAPEL